MFFLFISGMFLFNLGLGDDPDAVIMSPLSCRQSNDDTWIFARLFVLNVHLQQMQLLRYRKVCFMYLNCSIC